MSLLTRHSGDYTVPLSELLVLGDHENYSLVPSDYGEDFYRSQPPVVSGRTPSNARTRRMRYLCFSLNLL